MAAKKLICTVVAGTTTVTLTYHIPNGIITETTTEKTFVGHRDGETGERTITVHKTNLLIDQSVEPDSP